MKTNLSFKRTTYEFKNAYMVTVKGLEKTLGHIVLDEDIGLFVWEQLENNWWLDAGDLMEIAQQLSRLNSMQTV